ncbi:MAG TPA: hypothetical protein ENJ35_08255, partial [Gammaproteobacteria bacterium]|nr:hypothetical protein [Gammaproteobacteria bacterium]
PRIGPFPGPTPQHSDWGYELDLRYGRDAAITFGFDDELEINDDNKNLWLMPQWFIDGFSPLGHGISWIAGSWFSSVGYEIGAPVDPPTSFYTHSYAFAYAPVKHVGVMASARLPGEPQSGMTSLSLGIVQGWNNLQDNNNDKSLIFDLHWRSHDFKTWIDFENIIGNEQTDNGHTEQTRPFNAISSNGKKLLRRFHSLTITHRINPVDRMALNMIYGFQEGGDVVAAPKNPPGFLITRDSPWYGINLNAHHKLKKNLQASFRLEWLKDKRGAHALLPAGDYYAATASLSWWPEPHFRIRPELRYDRYHGSGKPFGGKVPTVFFGDADTQWTGSIDATWFISS